MGKVRKGVLRLERVRWMDGWIMVMKGLGFDC